MYPFQNAQKQYMLPSGIYQQQAAEKYNYPVKKMR